LPGRAARLRLGQEREIEIDLSRPGKRTIAAFRKGKFVDRMSVPMSDGISLMGGDRDEKSVWFFAVRRDKPLE
jgi:hypothetical protein